MTTHTTNHDEIIDIKIDPYCYECFPCKHNAMIHYKNRTESKCLYEHELDEILKKLGRKTTHEEVVWFSDQMCCQNENEKK
jgi:hypothetical protein